MIKTNIGARVKALRESRGMDQAKLATVLGLENRQTVSDIERGQRRLSAGELVALTDCFGATLDQLTNPFLLSAKDSFSWRQRNVSSVELDGYEVRAGEWIGAYRELARLNDTRLKRLLPRLGLTHASSFENAAEAGEDVAEELKLGERPALQLAQTLEKQLGMLVLMVDAIEGVSGAACRLQALNAILINRNESQGRRNSDLAHEFFHILTWEEMKPERVELAVEAWDRAPLRSHQRNLRIERLADNFASGLLMPSWELDRLGDPQGDIVEWLTAAASELGVSARGLRWRLVNSKRRPELSKVPNELLDEAARVRGVEEAPLRFSKGFIGVLIQAIEAGYLSGARAAKLTDLSKAELGSLCEAYALSRPAEL